MLLDCFSQVNIVKNISSLHPLLLQLLDRYIIRILAHNSVCHFPHLNQIVFRCAAQHPWIVHIPTKVGYPVGVTAMHEESIARLISLPLSKGLLLRERGGSLQLRRSVLCIIGCLLLSYATQVPKTYPSVAARAAQNSFFERVPC